MGGATSQGEGSMDPAKPKQSKLNRCPHLQTRLTLRLLSDCFLASPIAYFVCVSQIAFRLRRLLSGFANFFLASPIVLPSYCLCVYLHPIKCFLASPIVFWLCRLFRLQASPHAWLSSSSGGSGMSVKVAANGNIAMCQSSPYWTQH